MQDISFAHKEINIEALDEAIREALGDQAFGVSTGPESLVVHLGDDATQAEIEQVRNLVQSHDATQLTERQQKQQARRQKLEQMRQNDPDELLDPDNLSIDLNSLRRLARKVARLELEILNLRGELGPEDFPDSST